MVGSDRERAKVLDYWRSVELFSPPGIPKRDHRRHIDNLSPESPLPWEPEHRLSRVRLKPNRVWQHHVYLGCYQLERVTEVLGELYGEDPNSYDGQRTESALAALVVAADGIYLNESSILSTCAWATGQLLMHGALLVGLC
jgi:hypothetical protein